MNKFLQFIVIVATLLFILFILLTTNCNASWEVVAATVLFILLARVGYQMIRRD